MLKYTLPLFSPDRGCVHADSSLKLHLSTETIMYTDGDTTCHLMTMDPVTRTASGARQIRSPSQLTEGLALLQVFSSSLSFRRNISLPFFVVFFSEKRLCTVHEPGSNTEIQVTVEE